MESRLLGSLVEALKEVPDTRKARGQRHPFAGLLALVFLGCLCRHTEMAVLQRWADDNWDVLREPLGFTRDKPPHATTISRTLAPLDIPAFETAFVAWLGDALLAQPLAVAAVDGQTSKQGHDKDGDPIHTLNVFAHDLKVTLAQWPVTDEKATEPEVLKAHLNELFKRYPGLSPDLRCHLLPAAPRRLDRPGRSPLLVCCQGQPTGHDGGDAHHLRQG